MAADVKFKPMLAEKCEDIDSLKYPVMVSAKLDGIRMIVKNGVCYSRSMKPIPSPLVQQKFKDFDGFDGELIYGEHDQQVFSRTTSVVMSKTVPEWVDETQLFFYVFDITDFENQGFRHRYTILENSYKDAFKKQNVILHSHFYCYCSERLKIYEQDFLNSGYEGLMVRSLDGPYKQGRSTLKEGYLLKVKTFSDSEAEVVGYYEMFHNENEAEESEIGGTKRSTKKEGLVPAGVLGGLQVRDLKTGVEFGIGSGFTVEQRRHLWNDRDNLVGQIVKYSFFEQQIKDKPRFPTFIGFRHYEDMS